MSFSISLVGGEYRGCRVGTNGSQYVMMGYWLAAYAVAGRAESNRVCAWVDSSWDRLSGKLHPDAPRTERNRPSTVAALIAFSYDDDGDGVAECGAALPQDSTIRRGLKLKAPSDPMLADLAELYLRCCDGSQWYGTLHPELSARLADHFDALVPHLAASESWADQMREVAGVFAAARARGSAVRYG